MEITAKKFDIGSIKTTITISPLPKATITPTPFTSKGEDSTLWLYVPQLIFVSLHMEAAQQRGAPPLRRDIGRLHLKIHSI